MLLGHSFGALVLGNTISHSILGSSSPWDMAVAFNSAASSVNTRQLMQELDYLYKYDPQRRAYVSRSDLLAVGRVVQAKVTGGSGKAAMCSISLCLRSPASRRPAASRRLCRTSGSPT